ncbi:MAG: type I-E CRISPR-associated protein Cas5/CasD [Blastocatellales bacterium]|nr:type I-E CRISPR-associated protein Cas5/CasD [Blastocatellales bacterium]
MKRTLLLRLAGPMQSWGTQSRFSIRDTGLEPSKSGVFGLLCAALGVTRDDEATLKQLRENLVMGVRVDREGIMKKDFHTAKDVAKASGSGRKETEISDRWYLADADFLVALESEDEAFLHKINDALARPVWQIFLGRKSFVPSQPVRLLDAPLEMPLFASLAFLPWETNRKQSPPQRLRVVIDTVAELPSEIRHIEIRQDVPLSFIRRSFMIRQVRTGFMETPKGGA